MSSHIGATAGTLMVAGTFLLWRGIETTVAGLQVWGMLFIMSGMGLAVVPFANLMNNQKGGQSG